MQRLRLVILLSACFLTVSTVWADELGYVDCTNHPDSTPVFNKARQTPDTLGTIPCGERFTILVYGFVFSRVQTKDGKVGYVYSNVITPDHGGAVPAQAASARVPATPAPAPPAPAAVANASVSAPAAAQPTSTGAMNPPSATPPPAPAKPTTPQVGLFPTPPTEPLSSSSESVPAPAQPAPAQVPAPAVSASAAPASAPSPAPVPASGTQPTPPAPSQPTPPAPAEAQPPAPQPTAPSASAPPQNSAPAQPGPLFPPPPSAPAPPSADATAAPTPAADSAPASAAASEPQPETAQPAAAPVRSANVRSSWERPLPSARHGFLLEMYGGYAFDRVGSSGSYSNLSGGMGAFGYNLKPWLQIVGDTSYNLVTGNGVKNVLYGNHFGGRVFYGRASRWGITPFAEALVGGSRFDVTVSGVGGYKTSQNCISYKAGGGLDFRVGRRWEVRVIDVDYYRTSFGTNSTQNNYWATAGVVLRIFGGSGTE